MTISSALISASVPLLALLAPVAGLSSNNMMNAANNMIRSSASSTRLYHNDKCPFAQKAWLALEALGVKHQQEVIDLYGPNGKPKHFLELTPTGNIPVLETYGGAVVMWDSDTILDEISKGHFGDKDFDGGPKLCPTSSETEISEWRSAVNAMLPVGKDYILTGKSSTLKELQTILTSMEEKVVGPYLVGECVTAADCHAYPFFWRLVEDNDSKLSFSDNYPKLEAWVSKCRAEEVFSKTMPKNGWWWWW